MFPTSSSNEIRSRRCPGCGNLTPADNPRCAHCGLGSVEAVIQERKLASERHFLQALFTRSNPFTMIFIGINVGVYVLMCLAGGIAITSPDLAVLIGFGAKQNDLIAHQHQYWRLVTSIFIHIGLIHLLINNYALWIIGQEIERIYGSSRFVVLYVATGILGSIGSYAFNPQATSAGASGAIFGLFGVMATFAFRYRREIPAALSREIKRRVIPIIALNLIFGLSVRIVDNAAHIGGLLSGIALALVVPYKRPHQKTTPLVWRALQVICLAAMFVSFVGAFRSYEGPRLSLSNLTTRPSSNIVNYFENMQQGSKALSESARSFQEALNSRNGNADVSSSLRLLQDALRNVRSIPQIDTQSQRYRDQMIEILSEQQRILTEFTKTPLKDWQALGAEEDRLIERNNKFVAEFDEWLPGFMNQHGYELRGRKNS
ncbi:MAG TPA: rhomboid family intramembrane serine protease [Blastocatellia bacterium]|nr:rhomboid family intramembrane serine protease [Blastocatellia bacterium]